MSRRHLACKPLPTEPAAAAAGGGVSVVASSLTPRLPCSDLLPQVFMCSVVRRMGYGEGFRWMSQYIK